jgi:predicted MFS family arabinose efflux permease
MSQINGRKTLLAWQIGIIFSSASLFILVSTLPMFIGALVKHYAMTEASAAILMGGELALAALSAAFLSRKIASIDRRIIAAFGLLLVIVANLAMFYVDSLSAIIAVRGLAGIGCGLTYACAYSSLSNLAKPSLTMVLIGVIVFSATIVMFTIEIPLTASIGRAAPFAMLMVVAIIALLTTPLLPRSANADLIIDEDALGMTASQHIPLLLSYVLCLVAMSMVIPFAERIGAALHLLPQNINYALAGSAIASVLGPALMVAFGDRFSYRQYISLAMIISIASALLLVLGTTMIHFVLGCGAAACAAGNGQIAYNDLGARSDRTGRMSAIMSSLTAFSFALSPLIGGAAIGIGGLKLVLVTALLMLGAALVLLFSRPSISL